MSDKVTLTTSAGAPIADNQNAITAGRHSPVLLQDYQLLEKLAHQNRERIPERTVHVRGWGWGWAMRFFEPLTGNPDAYYEPNSFNGPVEDPRFVEPPLELSGDAARYNHRDGNDDYRQAGDLFRLIGKEAPERLVNNVAEAMQDVPIEIVERQLGHFAKADPEYAAGVAHALRMTFRQAAE